MTTSPPSGGEPEPDPSFPPRSNAVFELGLDLLKGFAAGAGIVLAVLVGLAFVVGLLLGFIGGLLGMDPGGAEVDKLLDDYYEPIYYGVVVIGLLVGGGRLAIRMLRQRAEGERPEQPGPGPYPLPTLQLPKGKPRRIPQVTPKDDDPGPSPRPGRDDVERLDREIEEKLARLAGLDARIEEARRQVTLSEEQARVVDAVVRKHFDSQSRAQLVLQVAFSILAFLLGFVVNWLSEPALTALRTWWAS
ncbi:hypothetical protein [Nonomuraea zeae]|uniref:Uncharacterized protein n=1 Tax=Nonomuraea zeae TaxID=1642303 RepID=A0A5S4FIN5_9ACTN|nr:hypothetical protein [Nonomuraea zeae]TMR20522.1 hypothetical protein ETD85_52265 [Nonomuraea zeae]